MICILILLLCESWKKISTDKGEGLQSLETKRIIYYTIENDHKKTLSLRSLCAKDTYENGLEAIFYAVRDSSDAQTLLEVLRNLYYESFELIEDTIAHILFKVVDVYENTNYLKLQKVKKFVTKENTNENN